MTDFGTFPKHKSTYNEQIKSATVIQSPHMYGQQHLCSVLVAAEALKAMEKVASHINEMQKIYEDYGSVFDQLVAEQTGHDKEVDTHFGIRFYNPHDDI